MRNNMKKTVLITGTSSGIGYELASYYLSKGYEVIGISRRSNYPTGMTHIQTDLEDYYESKKNISEYFLNSEIPDLIILNAGFGISGPIECCSYDSSKKQFIVNYFGSLIVLEILLPLMRRKYENRKEKGLIIFMSSLASYFPLPYQAHYSASKSAITTLSRALRMELNGSNVNVTAIHPGDICTEFTLNRQKQVNTDSYLACNKSIKKMENDELNGKEARWLVNKIIKIENKKYVKPIYVPGINCKFIYILQKMLPTFITDFIINKIYNK